LRSWPEWVKGYGEVRRRLSRGLGHLLENMLPAALAEARQSGRGYARAAEVLGAASRRMLEDEKGESLVESVG
jgi:hypothetical protein